jgi:hypothetical protein
MTKSYSRRGLLLRFLAAAILIIVTYNPEGYSYYHWMLTEPLTANPPKLIAGLALAIAWTTFVSATYRALGTFGTILMTMLFGALIWGLLYYQLVTPNSPRALSYLLMLLLATMLTVGCYWPHIRSGLRARRKAHRLKDRARSAV